MITMKIRFYDEYDHWTYGGESFTQRFEPVITTIIEIVADVITGLIMMIIEFVQK